MKRFSSIISMFVFTLGLAAQAPQGYYDKCQGKTGKALLESLNSVMGAHTTVSYDGLWEVYKTSDVRADGSVWDIYSTKAWRVGAEHCGNYKNVGDCINREHSFPKSWFSERSPMKSDAFHVYPTDGKVNGQRSNYPYGECAGGSQVAANGNVKPLGRLGSSTFAGYSGTVFEPDDQYKGDLARTYFYMAAAYYSQIGSWSSPMLNGTNYPAYSTWAVNLLLKWHRQDPVSEKETDRNEAVYKHQRNRNPFIDHPELVEYIWGNKQGTPWSAGGEVEPVLNQPVNGATYDLGITGLNVMRSITVPVKGSNLKEAVTASVTGTGFSVTPATVQPEAANSGRTGVYVSYKSAKAGKATGILRLTCGNITTVVNITAEAMAGLPAAPATDVTETSFTANWANIDDDGVNYSLDVRTGGESIAGYPRYVVAEDESYTVTDLEPGTTYTYTLSNSTLTSNAVTVTTAEPTPSIQFLYDGELGFATDPGVESEIAEILLDIDWIDSNITIAVEAPFSVSTDKASWATSCVLVPGEDRFYLRLLSDEAGTFTTTVIATAGDYINDNLEVVGVVGSGAPAFFEDFEPEGKGDYNSGSYTGSAGSWVLNDTGWWSTDKGVNNSHCIRMGKTSSSSIATATAKKGGIGTVSLQAMRWSANDGSLTVAVEYSSDAQNWVEAATLTIDSDVFASYEAKVNVAGMQYMRLRQKSGARAKLDNLAISDYTTSGVEALEYHSWDAFSRADELIIENKVPGALFTVCGVDGIVYLHEALAEGETSVKLPLGLYLVNSNGFTRRVVIK